MGPSAVAMKKIKSQVTYTVPNWNFCNNDNLLPGGHLQKDTCRFCIKTKTSHHCVLYDRSLSVNDGLIEKVRECCKATAGFASSVEEPTVPTIEPRELIKQTIDLYNKTVNKLISQGYPRQIAEAAAKVYLLDN